MRVVLGVDVQHRHGAAGLAGGGGVGPRNRGHGPKQIGRVAGQAVAHHAAIGHAGGKDAVAVNGAALLHIGHHGAGKAHIVHATVARIAAATPGVPGGELAAGQLAVPVGEGNGKALALGHALQAIVGIVGHVFGMPAATVKGQHQRHRLAGRQPRGHVQQVAPLQTAMLQHEFLQVGGTWGVALGGALGHAFLQAFAQGLGLQRAAQQQRAQQGQNGGAVSDGGGGAAHGVPFNGLLPCVG